MNPFVAITLLGGSGVLLWKAIQTGVIMRYVMDMRDGETAVLICPEAHPVMIDMATQLLRMGMKVLVVLGQRVNIVYFRRMVLGWNPLLAPKLSLVRANMNNLEHCYKCAIDIAKRLPEINYLLTFPQISEQPDQPLDYYFRVNHLASLLFHLELSRCLKPTSVVVVVYRNAKYMQLKINNFKVENIKTPQNARESFTTSDIASIIAVREIAKRFKHQVFAVDLNERHPWTLFRSHGYLLGSVMYVAYDLKKESMPMKTFRMFTLAYYLTGKKNILRANGLPHSNYKPQPSLVPNDESVISATWKRSCELIAEKAPASVAKNIIDP